MVLLQALDLKLFAIDEDIEHLNGFKNAMKCFSSFLDRFR
jgi:hypothetical protein